MDTGWGDLWHGLGIAQQAAPLGGAVDNSALEELNRAYTQLSRILELSGNPIAVLDVFEDGA
ncbi:MAG: hypothetical protein FJ037_09435 [Chloroflexi bacterium]|nr:hypothetical protein [Chloroflexota bacterium]